MMEKGWFSCQHGFIGRKRSIYTAKQDLKEKIEKGEITGKVVLFVDYKSAYDSVKWDILREDLIKLDILSEN